MQYSNAQFVVLGSGDWEYDYEIKQSDDSNCSLKAYFDNDKALTNSFICLSPQSETDIDALPDMTGGTFSGYFKFENMDARGSLDIVNDKFFNKVVN